MRVDQQEVNACGTSGGCVWCVARTCVDCARLGGGGGFDLGCEAGAGVAFFYDTYAQALRFFLVL